MKVEDGGSGSRGGEMWMLVGSSSGEGDTMIWLLKVKRENYKMIVVVVMIKMVIG